MPRGRAGSKKGADSLKASVSKKNQKKQSSGFVQGDGQSFRSEKKGFGGLRRRN